MLAAAAAAVANSAKKPSTRPPSKPPRVLGQPGPLRRRRRDDHHRTPHDPRAGPRAPSRARPRRGRRDPSSPRPRRSVDSVGSPAATTAREPPTGRRAHSNARPAPVIRAPRGTTPHPLPRRAEDVLRRATSHHRRRFVRRPSRLRVTVADLEKTSEGAVSTPGDDASPPPSTRRSSTDARRAFPFASGNGVGTPEASLVGTPHTAIKPSDDVDDAPPNWGPPVAANPAAAAAAARNRAAPPPPPPVRRKIASIDPCPRFPASPTGNTCYLNAALRLCGDAVSRTTDRRRALRETSPVFSAFARLAARRRTRALADAGARGTTRARRWYRRWR